MRAVHGIGPKTVDHLGSLAGRSGVAVDVHRRAFARGAGVEVTGYAQLREVYEQTAEHLGRKWGGLEHELWRHMSGRRRG